MTRMPMCLELVFLTYYRSLPCLFFLLIFLSLSSSPFTSPPHHLLDSRKSRVSIVLHYEAACSVHRSLFRNMCGSTTKLESTQFQKNENPLQGRWLTMMMMMTMMMTTTMIHNSTQLKEIVNDKVFSVPQGDLKRRY